MNCPKCGTDMGVLDSRKFDGLVKRRRKCPSCHHLEWTVEVFGSCANDANSVLRDRLQRDKAIGALGVLVYDGVISLDRMQELMDRDVTLNGERP